MYDPILEAEAYIDNQIDEYERIKAASSCADCFYCKRIFDYSWFANSEHLAICARDGLDWDERATRWSEPACDDFTAAY